MIDILLSGTDLCSSRLALLLSRLVWFRSWLLSDSVWAKVLTVFWFRLCLDLGCSLNLFRPGSWPLSDSDGSRSWPFFDSVWVKVFHGRFLILFGSRSWPFSDSVWVKVLVVFWVCLGLSLAVFWFCLGLSLERFPILFGSRSVDVDFVDVCI